MSNDEAKRRYADNLLAVALHARGRGDVELAEDLVARAFEVLDELNRSSLSPPTSSTPMQQQPQQQQQQQQRSNSKKADEDD